MKMKDRMANEIRVSGVFAMRTWTENGHTYMDIGGITVDVDEKTERQLRGLITNYQLSTGTYNMDQGLKHGTYTKSIRGTVNYVTDAANKFYELMGRDYPQFMVISTNTVTLPDSICMHITYKV